MKREGSSTNGVVTRLRKTGASRPTSANRAALASVRAHAERYRERDRARIQRVLEEAALLTTVDDLCSAIARAGTLTINFHPDRILPDGRCVAQALYDEGVYRSQFESRISNGGLTAFPGGDRDRWEQTLFGGAYHAPGVEAWERPKYGGLDLFNFSNGACPRFGSCHLRLTQSALDRSTFFFGDSASRPDDGGVIDAFEPVLAGLLETLDRNPDGLGRPDITVSTLLQSLFRPSSPDGLFAPVESHELDMYIEAQIHGAVDLETDVEALIIDPSFSRSETGALLLRSADRYGFVSQWNSGMTLVPTDVPTENPIPDEPRRWRAFCADGHARRLAERVVSSYAGDGNTLDAAAIGQAAVSVVQNPDEWVEWGAPADALTCLKDLWLILVFYGKAA